MIITIDGPSGNGKSSTAKGLAKALGFLYIDTGAMYRAFTYLCLREGGDPLSLLSAFDLHIESVDGEKHYFVGEEDVSEAIRAEGVNAKVSEIAAIREVRKKIVSLQREMGKGGNCVFEGRDLGSVVFSDANVKIFLTARPEVRARRRFLQMGHLTEEEILQSQERRDVLDSTRKISPLQPAEDAWIFDTSDLTLDEVIEQLTEYVRSNT